jgi:hypothetical protein
MPLAAMVVLHLLQPATKESRCCTPILDGPRVRQRANPIV